MKNYILPSLSSIVLTALLTTGCASHRTVQHVVYSPGENLTALTKVTESEYICDYPYGGDNGRNIFFTMHDKGKAIYSNIYRKEDPVSASMSQKTAGKNQNTTPSYCAATDMVAFAGQLEGSTISDIYMVNASKTNALTQVTNTPDVFEAYPSISRDGKRIAYEKRSVYGRLLDSEIWVKNLQTNENIMLGLGRMPSFSPDGKSITYVRYASDGKNTCLCTINADGSNQMQLTDVSMGLVWRPCYSPDGSHIVFQCLKPQKNDFDLYVVDRNGNGLTQLTINNSFDGEPYWANDGNIYFTSDRGGRDGHYQIWRFRFGASTSTGTPIIQNTQPTGPVEHTVQQGETITQIAQRYGVTVRDIVKWNNLQSMTLKQGMRIKVSE